MTSTLTIEKSYRDCPSSDSEARVMVEGRCAGFLTGVVNNVGSFLHPQYRLTRYIAEVDVGSVEHKGEFETRSEAVKWIKGLFA